jgi:excisionase family DNA binding protein
MSDLMNTQEVVAYLRIKERKIYDLVRQGGIPCTRVGGKWLFPRDRIDQWLERAAFISSPLKPARTTYRLSNVHCRAMTLLPPNGLGGKGIGGRPWQSARHLFPDRAPATP